MAKLDAMDAFAIVLDRLVGAEKRAVAAEEVWRESRAEIELLRRDLNNARSDVAAADVALANFNKSQPAFIALYDAVEEATRVMLVAIPSCQSTGAAADLLSRAEVLRAAVVNAKEFIDPIPF